MHTLFENTSTYYWIKVFSHTLQRTHFNMYATIKILIPDRHCTFLLKVIADSLLLRKAREGNQEKNVHPVGWWEGMWASLALLLVRTTSSHFKLPEHYFTNLKIDGFPSISGDVCFPECFRHRLQRNRNRDISRTRAKLIQLETSSSSLKKRSRLF